MRWFSLRRTRPYADHCDFADYGTAFGLDMSMAEAPQTGTALNLSVPPIVPAQAGTEPKQLRQAA